MCYTANANNKSINYYEKICIYDHNLFVTHSSTQNV